jgi:hypothetical protein
MFQIFISRGSPIPQNINLSFSFSKVVNFVTFGGREGERERGREGERERGRERERERGGDRGEKHRDRADNKNPKQSWVERERVS